MKWWVLQIICINRGLDNLCDKLDKEILRLALNMFTPCDRMYQRVLDLRQRRLDLINLRVLYNLIMEGLTEGEAAELESAATCPDIEGYIDMVTRQDGAMLRLLKQCAHRMVVAGYYSKKLESVYPYLAKKRGAKVDVSEKSSRFTFGSAKDKQHNYAENGAQNKDVNCLFGKGTAV